MKAFKNVRSYPSAEGAETPRWLLLLATSALVLVFSSACDSGPNEDEVVNQRPEITSVTASPNPVHIGGTVTLSGRVRDPGGLPLFYNWECTTSSGSGRERFTGGITNKTAHWVAPDQPTHVVCTFSVIQGGGLFGGGNRTAASVDMQVTAGN